MDKVGFTVCVSTPPAPAAAAAAAPPAPAPAPKVNRVCLQYYSASKTKSVKKGRDWRLSLEAGVLHHSLNNARQCLIAAPPSIKCERTCADSEWGVVVQDDPGSLAEIASPLLHSWKAHPHPLFGMGALYICVPTTRDTVRDTNTNTNPCRES